MVLCSDLFALLGLRFGLSLLFLLDAEAGISLDWSAYRRYSWLSRSLIPLSSVVSSYFTMADPFDVAPPTTLGEAEASAMKIDRKFNKLDKLNRTELIALCARMQGTLQFYRAPPISLVGSGDQTEALPPLGDQIVLNILVSDDSGVGGAATAPVTDFSASSLSLADDSFIDDICERISSKVAAELRPLARTAPARLPRRRARSAHRTPRSPTVVYVAPAPVDAVTVDPDTDYGEEDLSSYPPGYFDENEIGGGYSTAESSEEEAEGYCDDDADADVHGGDSDDEAAWDSDHGGSDDWAAGDTDHDDDRCSHDEAGSGAESEDSCYSSGGGSYASD